MCGRFTLHHSTEEVAQRFAVQETLFTFPARYNVAPSQPVAAIVHQDGLRVLDALKWGLVPFWAKDPEIGNRLINARAESLLEKPAFKNAYKKRRCLIPADGFYEWKAEGRQKQPMHIRFADSRLFAFAGLYEEWQSPDGSPLRTCTIVTTEPNALLATLHHRMAVILRPEDEAAWLDPRLQDPTAVSHLLRPFPDEEMEAYPINKVVNSPAYEGLDCIAPLAAEAAPAQGSLF